MHLSKSNYNKQNRINKHYFISQNEKVGAREIKNGLPKSLFFSQQCECVLFIYYLFINVKLSYKVKLVVFFKRNLKSKLIRLENQCFKIIQFFFQNGVTINITSPALLTITNINITFQLDRKFNHFIRLNKILSSNPNKNMSNKLSLAQVPTNLKNAISKHSY